jgi:hypothetical protein
LPDLRDLCVPGLRGQPESPVYEEHHRGVAIAMCKQLGVPRPPNPRCLTGEANTRTVIPIIGRLDQTPALKICESASATRVLCRSGRIQHREDDRRHLICGHALELVL